jgi:hypothetical protein
MKIIKCARCGNEIYRLDNDWCTSCLVEAGEPVPIAPAIPMCGYNGCRQQVLGNNEHCYYHEKVKQNRIQPTIR